MSTTTYIYRFEELVNAVNAVMPHIGNDKITPIINGIQFTADGALQATDRFTVGEYRPKSFITVGDDPAGFVVDAAGVKWLAKLRVTALPNKNLAYAATVRLTVVDRTVRIEVCSDGFDLTQDTKFEHGFMDMGDLTGLVVQSATFSTVAGNYPPVARLFPETAPAESQMVVGGVNLNMVFVSRIATAAKWLTQNGCARWFMMPGSNPDNAAKPGPVYVEVGDQFRALIQPNLLRK